MRPSYLCCGGRFASLFSATVNGRLNCSPPLHYNQVCNCYIIYSIGRRHLERPDLNLNRNDMYSAFDNSRIFSLTYLTYTEALTVK